MRRCRRYVRTFAPAHFRVFKRLNQTQLLQHRVRDNRITEIVLVFIAVGVTAADLNLACVVVGRDSVSRVAKRVVVRRGVAQDVSDIITGDTELKTVTIAGEAGVISVVVRFAPADRDGTRGFLRSHPSSEFW